MGVPFRIVLYADARTSAESAAHAALDRVRQLNAIFSDYEFDSELSALSRTAGSGSRVPVSAELWRILNLSQALAHETEGAFDITVGPAVSLWRRARRVRAMPETQRLEEAKQAIGFQNLLLDPSERTVELRLPRMRLDLGGIAKGYAADEALKVLRSRGIDRALVAADGDIVVSDPPPDRNGWRVAIARLDVDGAPSDQAVLLKHAAISTSGDLSQRLEIDGRRYSHIVDPRTGIGLTDHSLVTVIAPDSTTADSLATALSVLGPEKGLRLIESREGCSARIVRQPGEKIAVHQSSRFKDLLAD